MSRKVGRLACRKNKLKSTFLNETIKPFDKYIWSIIKRHYMLSEQNILRKYPSFNPGVLKGALKRLKDEGWLIYIPSLDAYMSLKDYKERLTDGLADTFSDDTSE